MTDGSWRLNFGTNLYIPELVQEVKIRQPMCKVVYGKIKRGPGKSRRVLRLVHVI